MVGISNGRPVSILWSPSHDLILADWDMIGKVRIFPMGSFFLLPLLIIAAQYFRQRRRLNWRKGGGRDRAAARQIIRGIFPPDEREKPLVLSAPGAGEYDWPDPFAFYWPRGRRRIKTAKPGRKGPGFTVAFNTVVVRSHGEKWWVFSDYHRHTQVSRALLRLGKVIMTSCSHRYFQEQDKFLTLPCWDSFWRHWGKQYSHAFLFQGCPQFSPGTGIFDGYPITAVAAPSAH